MDKDHEKNVLIVDDSRSSLAMIRSVMAEAFGCRIDCFLKPYEALKQCDTTQYDLVLVDHVMPEMDGVQFTAALRSSSSYRTVPIIMITSNMDRHTRIEAIRAGATDFLPKPFDPIELQARATNLLDLRSAQVALSKRATVLAHEVELAIADLHAREEEIIWRLARAIEFRDGSTGEHVSRVASISALIASGVGLDPQLCRTIYLASPLHDIGKIAISDSILGNPGKLTPLEVVIMREHVRFGARILEGGTSELVKTAQVIAQCHHERWDGGGYPDGLSGTDIPIEARVVAIADVFDALCSVRPYKQAWSVERAYEEIVLGSGSHFDPACVAAFCARWSEIQVVLQAEQSCVSASTVSQEKSSHFHQEQQQAQS